ncbi:MAG: hypothetical protein QXG86_01555 [Candidatus Woesearchaeota archaeon]
MGNLISNLTSQKYQKHKNISDNFKNKIDEILSNSTNRCDFLIREKDGICYCNVISQQLNKEEDENLITISHLEQYCTSNPSLCCMYPSIDRTKSFYLKKRKF